MTAGVFVSGLTNRYGCRPITIVGSLISCVAFLLATVAPNSFVLLITYGIMGGVGFGLIYLPAIVTVGYYFTTKRAFATGIAVCGSGMGAFLFAPLCQWLLTVYDWKNALIILAGLILNCVVFGSLMRPLNIVVNSEEPDEIDLQKLKNTEPGVHSSLTINHLEPPLSAIQSAIQSEILTHKKKTKMRSISDTKSPVLEELLSPVLHKTHIHSSQRSIFLPPMAKKDVFYSGSTLNLKSESNGNLSFVSNNNNIHSIDRKYSYKLSVTSDSICYEKRDVNKDLKTDTNKETFGSILVQIFDLSVLKKPVMILLVVANVFGMTGYYIPFVYITQHVRNGIKDGDEMVGPGKAALILSAIGISNVFGRLFFGWFSDKVSGKTIGHNIRITALTINNFCLLMSGIATVMIPLWSQYWLLLIDCIVFASYMSLTSIILADLLGIEILSTTFGLISCFRGISSILGPPLAGALYDMTGSFAFVFISAGLLLIISSIIHCFVSKYENH
ncbi:unnamed protein product [Oppiella nova]|uniref:Major facilitator superfamily (MFS) profile domain-containing protein n=1 Tax=Oppiella nova TaxID=334625 RepID=A0A7R9QR00_9ACAR|nr:unnamed protein product [Oppiella nova]CAG2171878.1 unnamed protein product [Oppiella nova]